VDVGSFIAAVEKPVRRADAERLREMMERVTGEPATMWGPTIIGFGSYHYRYDSGHEGRCAAGRFLAPIGQPRPLCGRFRRI
jgi:hypothetical protein